MRTLIADLVRSIQPIDSLERAHLDATVEWIESDAPLFRITKPATPPQHLVAYFVLFDPISTQVLLVDHRKAGLWLPSGGHVEPNEHPSATVARELREELQTRRAIRKRSLSAAATPFLLPLKQAVSWSVFAEMLHLLTKPGSVRIVLAPTRKP